MTLLRSHDEIKTEKVAKMHHHHADRIALRSDHALENCCTENIDLV